MVRYKTVDSIIFGPISSVKRVKYTFFNLVFTKHVQVNSLHRVLAKV